MNTTQIWTNIIAYALQVGFLVGVGASLPALLRLTGGGRAPAARLLYWQLLLIACVALPWMRPWQSGVIVVPARTPANAVGFISGHVTAAAPHFAFPSAAALTLWLLAAGIVVRLVWLGFGFLKLRRHRRNGTVLALPPEWTGMAGNTTVLVSEEITGPVTFGLLRPVVLLPASFPSMPATMREAILFHELLHVERLDWLFTLGEEVIRAVFWFHPAIWWVLGEIQLAREQTVDQAVIDLTQARDPYVDTLLAMAGVKTELDLAPAPLFLRRRHLKQRVVGLIQEVRMSKTRTIFSQLAALSMMAVTCWFVTAVIPLHAQPQTIVDGPGVTVNMNGSRLLHRPPLSYPAEAAAKHVEGTVVVQVRLDAKGEVIDDAILSGPDELRRAVQQAVLSWHFDKSEASSTRVMNIGFVAPAAPASAAAGTGMAVVTADGQAIRNTPAAGNTVTISVNTAGLIHLQGFSRPVQTSGTSPDSAKIDSINVSGLSDSARQQLLSQLPIHVGDAYSPDNVQQISDAAQQFDSHLVVTAASASPQDSRPTPPGAQRIGANVQAANLLTAVRPIYPPLAKMARQQGTVKFETTISKEGTVEDLKVISGPPLLVASAMEAVKQWVYRPTLLNGVPVTVITTIDVNFSLAE